MKNLSSILILITLFTLALSWPAFFERLERLKEKKEEIIEKINLKNLGFSHLKDLVHFELPELKHIIPKDLDLSHHKEIDEFWTGLFENFGLPKPTDLINCFGTLSGPMFFRKLTTVNNLLKHSKAHDNGRLHTDYVQIEVIMESLERAHKCMAQTKDFERLTNSLDFSNDIQLLQKAKYLYFQAKFDSLADEFKSIVDEIDNKNFNKAGKILGDIFKKCVKEFKKSGEDMLAYQAFSNGISGSLGLPLPTECLDCYSSKEIKSLMDFFKGISHAVSEGRWYKADHSAAEYWESEGKALLDKISKKSANCDFNSKDTKQLGEKIGLDLRSEEFSDKMWDYTKDHNIKFYSYLKTMNGAFKRDDYLHAGSAYAHLLEAVAKSS